MSDRWAYVTKWGAGPVRSLRVRATAWIAGLSLLAGPTAARADELPAPTAATQRLLHELADGRRSFESLIDADVGVVWIDRSQWQSEVPPIVRRLCTARARRHHLRRTIATITRYVQAPVDVDARLSCHNRPGPPTCTLDAIGTGAASYTLTFALDPVRGVRLREIVALDVNGTSRSFLTDEARAVARARLRIAPPTCPGPAP